LKWLNASLFDKIKWFSQMEAAVSKIVTKISDPHARMEAYLDLVELISRAYGEKASPKSSYVAITVERENVPEDKYLGSQSLPEIREFLKQVKVIKIEYSIPLSFLIGSRLWHSKGEGVVMYGDEVSLTCSNLDPEEVRNLQELVRNSSKDYAIEFIGKRISGES
jgi:hypothetical protein